MRAGSKIFKNLIQIEIIIDPVLAEKVCDDNFEFGTWDNSNEFEYNQHLTRIVSEISRHVKSLT